MGGLAERARLYTHAAVAAAAALPRALSLVSNAGRPGTLVQFGFAPGDDLLCTPLLEPLAVARGPLWMMSNHPDLFRHNPSVARVVPYDDGVAYALSLLGSKRLRLRYHEYDAAEDRSIAPPEHIIHLLARRAGLDPSTIPLTPRMYLDDAERAWGRFGERQIAIQSSGGNTARPITTKEWFPERFQEVVDALSGELTVVQLGSTLDPPLRGAVDLRGKTSITQAAAVIGNSSAFVGLVGFLMHLAKAAGTRSVIVYGGREHPSQSGYAENVNVYTDLACAPCWYWNRCPYDRECMRRIQAADIVAAVRTIVDGS